MSPTIRGYSMRHLLRDEGVRSFKGVGRNQRITGNEGNNFVFQGRKQQDPGIENT